METIPKREMCAFPYASPYPIPFYGYPWPQTDTYPLHPSQLIHPPLPLPNTEKAKPTRKKQESINSPNTQKLYQQIVPSQQKPYWLQESPQQPRGGIEIFNNLNGDDDDRLNICLPRGGVYLNISNDYADVEREVVMSPQHAIDLKRRGFDKRNERVPAEEYKMKSDTYQLEKRAQFREEKLYLPPLSTSKSTLKSRLPLPIQRHFQFDEQPKRDPQGWRNIQDSLRERNQRYESFEGESQDTQVYIKLKFG